MHRSTIVVTVLDREGNRVDQAKLSSADAELIHYLGKFPGLKHVVLEACNVWPHVYDAARAAGAEVSLAHPYKTRLISEASLKSVPMAYAPEPPVRELRQQVRDRVFSG